MKAVKGYVLSYENTQLTVVSLAQEAQEAQEAQKTSLVPGVISQQRGPHKWMFQNAKQRM